MSPTTAILFGGPHHGERIGQPPEPLPERLVAITHDDGSRYARVGSQTDAGTGEALPTMRHDVDGSLTRAAMIAVGLDPDTRWPEPD